MGVLVEMILAVAVASYRYGTEISSDEISMKFH
jgi:hypothetical protein